MPFRLDDNPSTYQDVGQENEFSQDAGLVALPLASRTAGHRNVRLHGGIGFRRVRWKASKRGAPPLIPAAEDLNGDTLLSSCVRPSLPRPNKLANGYDWSVSGEYAYVQNDVRVPGADALPAGAYPFLAEAATTLTQSDTAALSAYSTWVGSAKDRAAFNALSASLVAGAAVDNFGNLVWPYLMIPAELSSNHLFGG